ncbi:hypothetical protein [Methylobacterium sp.]|uniref:ImuA family protein n=1 Tax=Methylobacterium sp. TaxID=409 RepID=UPI00258EA219|nr:hypothetical protein [Methylobacterium sp.]
MQPPVALSALRRAVMALEPGIASAAGRPFETGRSDLDAWLGGGLARGVLHEVHAAHARHPAAATGFGLGVALRAAGGRPLVWVRQDPVEARVGGLYGDGLAAFGLDPSRLVVVRARDPTGALRAVDEAARCTGLGAALVEMGGAPGILDLKASRRLTLSARASGVTLVMIRLDASACPSAATTRWSVAAATSSPFEAKAPGRPAFAATLLRHRAGRPSRTWHLEWDRDSLCFSSPVAEPAAAAPLPRAVVSVPVGGAGPAEAGRRRAG